MGPCGRGVDIWHAEDRSDRLYVLVSGEVEIVSGDRQARDTLLHTVTAGELFGELCFCAEAGAVRRTVARTTAPATVVEITDDALLAYMRTNNELLAPILFTVCLRLSECEIRTQMLAHRGAQERIGSLLLQLAAKVRLSGDTRATHVTLHATHTELARWAAMSRSHVTVTLGRFRRQRLIRYARAGGLTVNVPALAAYLDP